MHAMLLRTRTLRVRTDRRIVAWGAILRSRDSAIVGRVMKVLGNPGHSRNIATALTGLSLARDARAVDIGCTV